MVSYVYDAINPGERASFDAHLATCEQCRTELSELRSVRAQLGRWTPPGLASAFAHHTDSPTGRRAVFWARLREIPAWAQVAAALLVLGVAAGIANLDVRYGRDGLVVRTGWSNPATGVTPAILANPANPSSLANRADPAHSTNPVYSASPESKPWRADLDALEGRLRAELRTSEGAMRTVMTRAGGAGASAPGAEAEVIRRVSALIDESEHRQQRELALRVADIMRDVNAQRQADLVKIDRSLGFIQTNTGVEVAKQRELLNYLVRVSQRQ